MEFVHTRPEVRRVATERYFERLKKFVHPREERLWSVVIRSLSDFPIHNTRTKNEEPYGVAVAAIAGLPPKTITRSAR